MDEETLHVRYKKTGFIAERKKAVAERLLKKGTVEIIQMPKIKVLYEDKKDDDRYTEKQSEKKKPDDKAADDIAKPDDKID